MPSPGFIQQLQAAQIYLLSAGLILFLLLESLRPLVAIPASPGRVRHLARNLLVWLISMSVVNLLVGSAVMLGFFWLEHHRIGLFYLLGIPLVAQVVLGFLIVDASDYVFHRMSHQVRWLWLLHSVHHSDPHVDVSTNLRGHPFHLITVLFWKLLVIAAFGIPLWVLLVRELVAIPVAQLHHANIGLSPRWERWLRQVIVTPDMHKIHHSPRHAETDANFGAIFSFWDRWFKTYVETKQPGEPNYGLTNLGDKGWQTVIGMLKTPFLAKRLPEL